MSRISTGVRHLLVVDDDPSVRAGLPRILASSAVEVETVESLAEARQALQAEPVDLVLCDLCLAGSSDTGGLELISWVKERHPEIPVLLMTAFGSEEVRAEALRRGAAGYWEKGGFIPELVEKIRALGVPAGRSPAR